MKLAVFSVLCVFALSPALRAAEPAPDILAIDLTSVPTPGQVLSLRLNAPLPLYDTRAARRILATLSADQVIMVTAMDRYGLQVRGRGQNGPITGWVSQKAAFQGSESALEALAKLYQRQQELSALVRKKKVAIGMTLRELTLIMGAPTNRHIVAESGKREETATWTKMGTLNLGKGFEEPFADLGVTPPVLEVPVETGRMTATLHAGVAKSIDSKFDGADQQISEITPPVAHPFLLTTLATR